MDEETTYGLSPDRLARLLALGVEANHPLGDSANWRSPAEILREILTEKPVLDPAVPDSLPVVLRRPCDEMIPVISREIGDLLLDSSIGLAVIKTVREYAMELVNRGVPEARKAAATVVYYAAVASALLFHGQRITQDSYDRLAEAFDKLVQTSWIPGELRRLCQKATAACRQQKEKAEEE